MDDPIAMLTSPDRSARLDALIALTDAKRRDAVPAVLDLLDLPDEGTREFSARFLVMVADLGDARVCTRLMSLLEDESEFVRGQAAVALGLLRYEPALPKMARMTREDSDELTRTDAMAALESLGRDEAFEALAAALTSDPSPLARRFAASAIRVVAAAPRLAAIQRLANSQRDEPNNLIHLRLAAERLGDPEATGAICDLLDAEQDTDDAGYLLHVIGLQQREGPTSSPVEDAARLLASVRALGQRLPDTDATCAELEPLLTEQGHSSAQPSDEQP